MTSGVHAPRPTYSIRLRGTVDGVGPSDATFVGCQVLKDVVDRFGALRTGKCGGNLLN